MIHVRWKISFQSLLLLSSEQGITRTPRPEECGFESENGFQNELFVFLSSESETF